VGQYQLPMSELGGMVSQHWKPMRGAQPPGGAEPVNPGGMDWWVTQRIPFDVTAPPSGNTGSMDWWITHRIPLNIYTGRP